MLARTLCVHDYRSYRDYELALDPRVTVLVGKNAVGKTNLVEALQLLCSGTSFRKSGAAELVREGAPACKATLRLEGGGRVVDLGLMVADGRRSFSRNGKKCRSAGVRGVLPAVLFCPDDLDMVKRSAGVRRRALDGFGVQLNERYADLARSYARIVEQRNALLKDPTTSPALIFAWNDSLAQTGSALLQHRLALLGRLRAELVRIYGEVAAGEVAAVSYGGPLGDEGELASLLRAELTERYLDKLEEVAEQERARGVTLVGPHRDDIYLAVDGRDARTFASQGQQRSLVLAWKAAEVEVTRDILGSTPLLLLDDVMSELDEHRRHAFMDFVGGEVQTVITTTNLGYFSASMLDAAKVVEIHGQKA